jgi:tetratricopeptide (TPR) repeat protein
MKVKELQSKYNAVNQAISEKRIKHALDDLRKLVEETHLGDMNDQLEAHGHTYENMLKYTLEGIEDPERKKVYNHLQRSILELADTAHDKILSEISGWHTYSLKTELEKEQKLTGKTVVQKLDDLSFKHQLDEVLKEARVMESPRQSFESQKHTEIISRIFVHFWLSNKFKEAEKDLVSTISDPDRFYWYERSLFVSSITISLLRYFDINKFFALYELYKMNEEEVWQRALIGLLLGFYKYDRRVRIYPELMDLIQVLGDREGFEKDLEMILLQFIRSGETEKISQKIRDEIVPEMTKLAPRLTEKLDLDKMIPDDFLEDKNPDWSDIFKESEGLYEKIEEFSKLQMEGADVFMSAFSQLKQFSFFGEMSNWFLPFHPDNPVIDDAFSFEDPEFDRKVFLEGLEKTGYMCNSDKYSFCLNVKLMPQAQKSMLLKLFQSELDSMEELRKEEPFLQSSKQSGTIYTQYIQDLYRFYKLFRFRNEFYDIFQTSMDFGNSLFFESVVQGDRLLRKIAEFYFEHESYAKAIKIYKQLDGIEEMPEILEKIGYAYQMLQDFRHALTFYLKAEIFNAKKEWIIKKIGLCYRHLRKPEKALEYYKRAEHLDPDNLYTQASIGYCYLDLQDYDQALKYYFKVEYLNPKNKKVWRPIAWCSFVLGKFDTATKYYDMILKESPNYHDLMNYGHLQWCLGNPVRAVDHYKKSVETEGHDIQAFLERFEDDQMHLINHGISQDDIPILLDHLQYQLNH